jgi:hypothetical protein
MKTNRVLFAPFRFLSAIGLLASAIGLVAADPCVIPPNPTGPVKLPPVGCEYLSPDDVHRIVDGLPPGTTIELSAFHKNFICGQDAGTRGCTNDCFIDPSLTGHCDPATGNTEEVFDSVLQFHLKGTGGLAGWTRDISIPNVMCRVASGPRGAGSPQTFPTMMDQLQGQLPPGDPDFDLLRVTAGNNFGLPSPGQTTLTQIPGGNWMVNSFFDITYRIDFIGAPGGHMAGMSGSTTATIRMAAAGVRTVSIPTVSQWGLIVLTLSVLAVGTIYLRRSRAATVSATA